MLQRENGRKGSVNTHQGVMNDAVPTEIKIKEEDFWGGKEVR